MARCGYRDNSYGSGGCVIVELSSKSIVYTSIFSRFVLVFGTFDGPYLCEFEAYGDSESTFTCLTFHAESIGILGFVERYREVAQIDISGLKNPSFVEIRVLSHDSVGDVGSRGITTATLSTSTAKRTREWCSRSLAWPSPKPRSPYLASLSPTQS